jgi:hypothetical protein
MFADLHSAAAFGHTDEFALAGERYLSSPLTDRIVGDEVLLRIDAKKAW